MSLYCDARPGVAECDANPRRPALVAQRPFTSLYTNLFGTNARLLSPFGATASDTQSYYYATAWSLVRYALDRYAGNESTFITALTQSPNTGFTNLLATIGNGVDDTQLIGGWATAIFADDYPGLASPPAETQIQTWNLRSLYTGLNTDFPGTYTLPFPGLGVALSFGTLAPTAITTLRGGGVVMYNLSGTQIAAQSVWVRTNGDTAPNANLRMRILRVE